MNTNRFRQQLALTEARFASRKQDRKERQKEIRRFKSGDVAGLDLSKIDEPGRIARRFVGINTDPFVGENIASGPSAKPANVDFLERILGQNDLITSWFLARGAQCNRTVGRIVIRSSSGTTLGFGTGFLVSPRLLLTNNHVLDSSALASTSSIQFDFVETLRGKQLTPVEFRLTPTDFFETDAQLDFSMVAVESENESRVKLSSRGWNPLIAESGKAIVGERVNIIQHPGGHRQQLGLRQNKIIDVFDEFMHYTTDTDRGSSGSPVFNDQWQVAALHHSGVPKKDKQGNILLVSNAIWDGTEATIGQIAWTANEGVRISRIVDKLNQREAKMTAQGLQLFKEIFAISDSDELVPDTPSVSAPASPAIGFSGVDEQGRATWTIPLQVSVELGNLAANVNQNQYSQSDKLYDAKPKAKIQAQATTIQQPSAADSTDFARAKQKIREHEADVYFDPNEDEEAVIDYYLDIEDEMVDEELFNALHELMKRTHTKVLSYKDARLEHLYPWIDKHPPVTGAADEELKLKSIYSGTGFGAEALILQDLEVAARHESKLREFFATESSVDQEAIEEFITGLEAADPFNCEHVVPQSWFAKKQPMKADMHHLFTCESGCNSFRSNIPYFQFGPLDEAVREHCGRRESDMFEPAAGKGPAARATMYFLLRYPGFTGDQEVEMKAERLSILLAWHEEFPVTDYERHRNHEIFKVQGNRNPLIDYPDWARFMALENGFVR